jgi:hypothetical protein
MKLCFHDGFASNILFVTTDIYEKVKIPILFNYLIKVALLEELKMKLKRLNPFCLNFIS